MSGYLKLPIVAAGGGGSGDVVGPASATDNAVARYDLATGKIIQDSLVVIDDDGRIEQTTLGLSTHFGVSAGAADDLTNNQCSTFGYESMNLASAVIGVCAFGYHSLYNATGGHSNSAFGWNTIAGGITSGGNNAAFGYNCLTSLNGSGKDNACFGSGSGQSCAQTIGNSFFGKSSGTAVTNGQYNFGGGYWAGSTNKLGSNNVNIGSNSGRGGVGDHSNNTFLGAETARSVTTGSDNIIIGYNQDLPTATTSDHLNIGGVVYGNLSTSLIGIGEATPAGTLHTNQASTTAAIPALVVEQGDIDDTFINFIGTSAADGTRSISSDTTEDSTKFGAVRVEINGTTKWIRIYDTES